MTSYILGETKSCISSEYMSSDSDRNEQQEDVIQPLQFFKCTKFGIVTLKACIGDSKKNSTKSY